MDRLDLSLAAPPSDLALDEALLDEAELGRRGETLRIWEFKRPVVVIGRGSKIDGEVDIAFCEQMGIPILRRCSGGAAIVAGPGCLMYSVVISFELHPDLRRVDEAHRWVMVRLIEAISRQRTDVDWKGTCDLTHDGRKFSGNSLRVARNHILYHGTILHDADLSLIARCLRTPPRQPEYRAGRDHRDFITNLSIDAGRLADDLAIAFGATRQGSISGDPDWPMQATEDLLAARYSDRAWHYRH